MASRRRWAWLGASCLANGVAAQRRLGQWRRDADGPGWAPAAWPMASRRRGGLANGVATQMGPVGRHLPGQWRRGAEAAWPMASRRRWAWLGAGCLANGVAAQ